MEARTFSIRSGGLTLHGETVGSGPPIVGLHGLTATRRYLVHGSNALPRAGFQLSLYDARGHGESDPPGPEAGYEYEELVADLEAVLADRVGEGRFVLAGHSMGCHTAVAYALEHRERVAGLVAIGPVYLGGPVDTDALAPWDALADALERDGVDGMVRAAVPEGIDEKWRETLERITRDRMREHRDLDAVARAIREVPRSRPFESLDELEFLDLPALVVASHDHVDPRHPYAVAEAYAQRLPRARLISEEEGDSPLAWQGGRLSREIAKFGSEPEVSERLVRRA